MELLIKLSRCTTKLCITKFKEGRHIVYYILRTGREIFYTDKLEINLYIWFYYYNQNYVLNP